MVSKGSDSSRAEPLEVELDDFRAKQREAAAAESGAGDRAQVVLHVYDVTNMTEQMNGYVRSVNKFAFDQLGYGGVFHGAVEIYGREWSFGYCPRGSGVYAVAPKGNPDYTYRQSIELGATALDEAGVMRAMSRLRHEWPGASYDTLKRNCCHFCEDLTDALGVPPPPAWLNKLAREGSNIVDTVGPAMKAMSRWWGNLTGSVPDYQPPAGASAAVGSPPQRSASAPVQPTFSRISHVPSCESSKERARSSRSEGNLRPGGQARPAQPEEAADDQ